MRLVITKIFALKNIIENSDTDSLFFNIHRSELDATLTNVKDFEPITNGWCNAFGYEINIKIEKPISINIKIEKAQLSHQDPFLPRSGTDVYKYTIESFVNRVGTIGYGMSKLRFLGCHKITHLNKTFYVKNTDEKTISTFYDLMEIKGLQKLELKKGKIKLVGNSRVEGLEFTIDKVAQLKK